MENEKLKIRAGRNKTVTVSESEIEALRRYIADAADVAQGFDFCDKMINGDLLGVIDSIPDGIADLIIIDPPYNLSKNFGDIKFRASSAAAYEEYLRSWFPKVCEKLSPAGTLYMCGDWKCTSSLQKVIEEHLVVMNRITWQREKGRGAKCNWKNAMEDIWFAVKNPDDYYFDVEAVKVRRRVIAPYKVDGVPKDWEETGRGKFRLTCPSNFWDDISVPFWSMPENTDHPTQKPEKLIAKLVLASSREGSLVFDPFMGSGTTCVVAKKLGRRYLGVDINSEYCLWAAKRMQNAASDASIQGYSDGVFWERNSFVEQNRGATDKKRK